jgi:ribosomal protein S18 acetylase RimI-like enzyme
VTVDHTLTVRRMSDLDMDAVCALIGLAFADNPSTVATVHRDRERAERLMRGAARVAKFGRPWSHALVAVQAEQIIGALNAAAWPDCQLTGLRTIAAMPAMTRVLRTALPRAVRMSSRRAAHDPGRPHWHIGPVGVHPRFQGRGVGTALLQHFLAVADGQGIPAFLETDVDRNVRLYRGLGFDVTGRETILGVDTRFMWRAARPCPGEQR